MAEVISPALDQRFRAMADSSPVLLWMAGTDARCVFFNHSWLSFRGRSLEQELGYGWSEGIHPEDFERCMNTYTDAFNARAPFEMEYRLQRADGAWRWILDRGVPRFEPDGLFAGFIGSCVDITEIKEGREVAERNALTIAKANEQIERFLFATSHDLREPVRMVATYAGLLSEEKTSLLDAQGRQFLDFVLEGAHRLREMVDGLNTFLGLRHVTLALAPVRLEDLVRTAESNLRLALAESGARIELGAHDVPFLGDARLLVRVLQNLLENAVKFRSSEPLVIRVSSERRARDVVISVEDNGIGFDDVHGERIFEMFQRLVTRDHPGSGIGLAICREIVELHHGKIWARSRPRAGATFSFSLPAATGMSAPATAPS